MSFRVMAVDQKNKGPQFVPEKDKWRSTKYSMPIVLLQHSWSEATEALLDAIGGFWYQPC